MGVDEAIEDEAINRFLLSKKEFPISSKKKPSINESPSVERASFDDNKTSPVFAASNVINQNGNSLNIQNPETMAKDTKKQADNCDDLSKLEETVKAFKGLSITKTATNTVFSDGNPDSEIMLIGEAPGAEEDAQAIPFCGASGKMLDQMLSYIGLLREKNFYITNSVFWRPPGNRRPTPEELAVCSAFVEKHISLINPKLIILIGGTAITSVLKEKQGITKLRGKFFEYSNSYISSPIPTTAIFHPSYLLRSPGQKRLAWQDLLVIKKYISDNNIKV